MKLHAPLYRDQTNTSIRSRDLSDPHAYSMVFAPLPSPTSQNNQDHEQDQLWPLRPTPTIQPFDSKRRPRSSSSAGVRRSSVRSSISRLTSISLSKRRSSVQSSTTRVNSPTSNKLSSDKETWENSRSAIPNNVSPEPDLSPRFGGNVSPNMEKRVSLGDATALPTISSKPSLLQMPFRAVVGGVRKLQEVPAEPVKVKSHDVEGKPVVVFTPGKGVYMAFVTLANLTVMVALDSTALSVALPTMARRLHGSALEAFWAAASYLLTSTVFQPTIGQLSDVFGRKKITLLAALLFLIGIFVSGIASNFTILITGRTVQGIGGGGIVVLTQLIICDLIPLRLRGQWFGVISGMYAVGTVSGPLLGGVFSEKVSWRWIFWINLPFVGIALVMIPLFIRLGVGKSSFFSKLATLDWIGSALFIASATSLMIPLSWGGVMYNWDSWRTITPLIAGLAGMTGLYFYEGHWAKNPIIRTSIFKNRNAAVSYLGVVLHGTVVTGSLYYLPYYYEAVKGLSPILSGVALFPETFTIAPGAFIVGALIARFNSYRWAVWAGWSITCLGLGLLWLLDSGTSTPQWIFMNLIVGIGVGFNYVALGVMLQASTKDEDMTSAVAMFTFGRLLGQALGVVVGGVTFENQLRKKLQSQPTLAGLAKEYANNGAALAELVGSIPEGMEKSALIKSYADGLKAVWMVFAAMAGTALLASLIIKPISLDRKFDPNQQLAADADTKPLAPSPEVEEVSWPLPVGQEVGIAEEPSEDTSPPRQRTANASRRASKRQSRWYGGPDTVGSRPIDGARSVKNRTSSRYSREIGGFYSFPHSIGHAHIYEPVLGHRPTSIFLPSVVHPESLEDLLEDDFDKLMKDADN